MHAPPDDVADDDVLAAVRAAWAPSAASADYLPIGFGAHHWRVGQLFVTLDDVGARHTADSLEAAYAGAARLALDFVVASLPSAAGSFTVPFADGALSATPWMAGARPAEPSGALPLVRRLEAVDPPTGLPVWAPLVAASFAEELADRLREPWTAGPYADRARRLLVGRLAAIEAWTATYHRLATVARGRRWVVTHGEPHERNQLVSGGRLLLVDWETLMLAPAERDLRWLAAPEADPRMLELFDLEWRLDEIAQYARWFEAPHGDTENERTSWGGLRHELARP